MLSSENYKKRLLQGAVDEARCFLIGKMTILWYMLVENLTKSANDVICALHILNFAVTSDGHGLPLTCPAVTSKTGLEKMAETEPRRK